MFLSSLCQISLDHYQIFKNNKLICKTAFKNTATSIDRRNSADSNTQRQPSASAVQSIRKKEPIIASAVNPAGPAGSVYRNFVFSVRRADFAVLTKRTVEILAGWKMPPAKFCRHQQRVSSSIRERELSGSLTVSKGNCTQMTV